MSGIVKASAASKSISGYNQKKGNRAELQVAKSLALKGWSLCFHGARTRISEIDLILEKNNQIVLIEVKTLDDSWRAFDRIRANQINKLKNNRLLFSRHFLNYKFKSAVAWVEKNRISFVVVD